jgi:hypothetical protein
MESNEKRHVCALCTQRCCDHLPGIFRPEDFSPEREVVEAKVRAGVESGDYQVDWYEASPNILYVRPTALDSNANEPHSGSWGGKCALLSESGCTLSWQERPYGCKTVVVNELKPGHCSDGAEEKRTGAERWKPYQNFLEELAYVVRPARWPVGRDRADRFRSIFGGW